MRYRFEKRDVLLLLTALLLTAGCAAPRETRQPEPEEELPTPAVRMSDFEDFDPVPYREQPPQRQADVEHDVPAELMQGQAESRGSSTARGFRVQVYSTIDKSTSVRQEEELKAWWQQNADDAPPDLFHGSQIPIYVVYIQPYYRVRIGNFTTRDAAERARRFFAQRFPDAFLVPDTVIVTR
ncbi:MAG: SPOR domain-containing protein [Rhodothermales bacterium]